MNKERQGENTGDGNNKKQKKKLKEKEAKLSSGEKDAQLSSGEKEAKSSLEKELMKKPEPKAKGKTKEEIDEEKKVAKQKMQELQKRSKLLDKTRMFMSRQQVMDLLPELCNEQDYKFRNTEVRNILLVGRSRSGKTTVIRTLRGVENAIKPLTIFSDTKSVNFRSFSLQGRQNTLDYTFNIIDTPGLFEVKRTGQKARTDEEILDMIADCLKNEITKIHAIILFCSLTAGVDNTDVIAMKKLIECFGTETNMAICVTRSENMSSEDREKISNELEEHKDMGDLITQVNNNIFFMGAVDPEKITDQETLKKYVEKVISDRAILLEFFFLCKHDTRIDELKFVTDKRGEVKKKIQERQKLVTGLLNRNLEDEQTILLAKNCLIEVQNLKHIVSLFDAECLELYAKLAKDVDELSLKLDGKENKKRKLI